jgi:hypothetical protein
MANTEILIIFYPLLQDHFTEEAKPIAGGYLGGYVRFLFHS